MRKPVLVLLLFFPGFFKRFNPRRSRLSAFLLSYIGFSGRGEVVHAAQALAQRAAPVAVEAVETNLRRVVSSSDLMAESAARSSAPQGASRSAPAKKVQAESGQELKASEASLEKSTSSSSPSSGLAKSNLNSSAEQSLSSVGVRVQNAMRQQLQQEQAAHVGIRQAQQQQVARVKEEGKALQKNRPRPKGHPDPSGDPKGQDPNYLDLQERNSKEVFRLSGRYASESDSTRWHRGKKEVGR